MKKLNPISQSTLIEDEYREFLRSEFHLSDEALRETFENQLDEAKKMIEDENYEVLEEWMKKANTLHEIL